MSHEKRRCLIVGAGGHCRALLAIIQEDPVCGLLLEGILDTRPPVGEELILGVPVIGSVADLESYFTAGISALFIAVGDNAQRKQYFDHAREIGFELPNLIASGAYLSPSAVLGQGNLLCHRTHLGPLSQIGNGNILNTGAILEHESSVGDFSHLAPGSVVSGRSHIGSLVFLGVNATVIDKVTVCDRVTVGAGTVVVRDLTEQDATYVGAPARRTVPR